MTFPIPKLKYKILKIIYSSQKIKISDLIKEAHASQKSAYNYINDLLASGVILEESEEKPALRYLRPNLLTEDGKLFFALMETEKTNEFFKKHKHLIGAFAQFRKEIAKTAFTAVIFGSFARGTETAESDIDIALIGAKINKPWIGRIVENCFVTLKNRVSLRIFDAAKFVTLLKNKDEFALQILNRHIVIANAYGWIGILIKT